MMDESTKNHKEKEKKEQWKEIKEDEEGDTRSCGTTSTTGSSLELDNVEELVDLVESSSSSIPTTMKQCSNKNEFWFDSYVAGAMSKRRWMVILFVSAASLGTLYYYVLHANWLLGCRSNNSVYQTQEWNELCNAYETYGKNIEEWCYSPLNDVFMDIASVCYVDLEGEIFPILERCQTEQITGHCTQLSMEYTTCTIRMKDVMNTNEPCL